MGHITGKILVGCFHCGRKYSLAMMIKKTHNGKKHFNCIKCENLNPRDRLYLKTLKGLSMALKTAF